MFVRRYEPDIFLIVERKMSTRNQFSMEGFNAFRQDRASSRRGGVAVMIRTWCKYERVSLLMLDLSNPVLSKFVHHTW